MKNVYDLIADKMLAELEKGEIPWKKPWVGTEMSWKRKNGEPYSLLNQILLPPGEYASFKQIKEEGGKVLKGAKAYTVVFYKFIKKELSEKTEDGEEPKVEVFPLLRYYNVYNIETQTTLEVKHVPVKLTNNKPLEACENLLNEYLSQEKVGFETILRGKAYYSPSKDAISIPRIEQFDSAESYYDTAFHEAAHSTGHEKRLNRIVAGSPFGSEEYSKEELIAEITSSAILNYLGISTEKTFKNNVAYVQNWLKALKNDKKMVVHAASKADKAFQMITGGEVSENSGNNKALFAA